MKKFTAFAMAALLAAFMAAPALAYTDVEAGTETAAVITAVSEKGIMEGYEDGSFKPLGNITRAEFAKVAVLTTRAKKGDVPMTEMYYAFDDVKEGAWYVENIQKAANMGLMKGDAEGTFRPNDTVSEAEVYTVMLRMLGYNLENDSQKWPYNYMELADRLGAPSDMSHSVNTPACRGTVAEIVDWALNQPLAQDKQADVKAEAALDTYAVVTAVGNDRVTVYTTAGETKSLRDTGSNGTLEPGQLVKVQADGNGVLQGAGTADVKTHSSYETTISGGKIKLNGKSYEFAKNAVVLTINSAGGVGTVPVDKLLESSYAAGLRSSRYTAPIQYVLSGDAVGCLLISDYAGQSELHFGFVEDVALNSDGTVVKFWGDDNDYSWDASKNDDKDPVVDELYAYTFRGDGVRGYLVDRSADKEFGGVVDHAGSEMWRLNTGKKFIVTDETVILKVNLAFDDSITDCELYDEVGEGDEVRVRYKLDDNDTGLEAAYVIIIDR